MPDNVFRLRGEQLSPLHVFTRMLWWLMQTHMRTADSAHKHTVQISVTFPSASNAKSSMLIPCFPQREKEWGTERPSSSYDSYRSHLVDGFIEQRRDTERHRQREKDVQVLENETFSLLICRGGLVVRVTFSISCASILSQWNMSWVSTPLPLVAVCTSGVGIVWQNKHDWYGKSTLSALWKACMRLLCNPGDTDFLCIFSSEDPPSKENPYEDIELERSCLGSKCVSPASSSPVPDTPTKVPDHKYKTVKMK